VLDSEQRNNSSTQKLGLYVDGGRTD